MPKQKPTPFLGTTTDINYAFPGLDTIDITITQDPYGYYLQHDWQRSSHFTKSTIPSHFESPLPAGWTESAKRRALLAGWPT